MDAVAAAVGGVVAHLELQRLGVLGNLEGLFSGHASVVVGGEHDLVGGHIPGEALGGRGEDIVEVDGQRVRARTIALDHHLPCAGVGLMDHQRG